MELCVLQHTHGRKFVFEYPWLAASWKQESVLSILELEVVISVRLSLKHISEPTRPTLIS
jgi:hypothetical protein